MPHVCVLGGGAAGTMAALAAAEAGARVTLVTRSYGATALSSGAVDLAGEPSELAGDSWLGRPTAGACLQAMLRHNPLHPIKSLVGSVSSALEFFCRAVPLYERRAVEQSNLILPTDLGTWKTTFLAQPRQAAGDITRLAGKTVRVLGIRGWGLFRASFIASSLELLARRGGVNTTFQPVEIDGVDPEMPLRSAIELARRMETDEAFAGRFRDAALSADMALGPAIFGVERVVDVGVAEVLASDRSVPGLRLQKALDQALANSSVTVTAGESPVSGCDAVVLATGRFIGGGVVRRNHRFSEPVFDAPITIGGIIGGTISGSTTDDGWLGALAGRLARGPHAFLRAGVRVDERLRVLDRANRPLRDNLFAAGSVIGDWDAVEERCGLGTSLVTGFCAGQFAAGR